MRTEILQMVTASQDPPAAGQRSATPVRPDRRGQPGQTQRPPARRRQPARPVPASPGNILDREIAAEPPLDQPGRSTRRAA